MTNKQIQDIAWNITKEKLGYHKDFIREDMQPNEYPDLINYSQGVEDIITLLDEKLQKLEININDLL